MVEEPQGQGGLDGEIRVPPLPAPPAAPAGCPGSDRLRGQPHRHIAASNESLIVGRPVRNAVLRLIRGMDLRLHPCSVAPAECHEKCGPNRPTPTGYSCNNAPARPWPDGGGGAASGAPPNWSSVIAVDAPGKRRIRCVPWTRTASVAPGGQTPGATQRCLKPGCSERMGIRDAQEPPGQHHQQRGEGDHRHGVRGRSAAGVIALSRSSRRRIFSALLFGNSSRNSIDRGIL